MKKIVALALALCLTLSMAAVAFAAPIVADLNGDGVYEDQNSLRDPVRDNSDYRLLPGEEYNLGTIGANVRSITVKWIKGGAMVESLKIKNKGKTDAYVLLTLNENFTITDAKELECEVTVKYNDGTPDQSEVLLATVGNDIVELDGYSKKADAKDDAIAAYNNTVYKCTEAGYLAFNSDNRLFAMVLRMVKNEKAFMYSNEDMIDAVEEKYGNMDAEINCYSFGGRPTFTNAAEFTLQADYPGQYKVYEWDGKALTAQEYTWNSIEGVYEWTTKSPKAYVISDKELIVAEESDNPETGGN